MRKDSWQINQMHDHACMYLATRDTYYINDTNPQIYPAQVLVTRGEKVVHCFRTCAFNIKVLRMVHIESYAASRSRLVTNANYTEYNKLQCTNTRSQGTPSLHLATLRWPARYISVLQAVSANSSQSKQSTWNYHQAVQECN